MCGTRKAQQSCGYLIPCYGDVAVKWVPETPQQIPEVVVLVPKLCQEGDQSGTVR